MSNLIKPACASKRDVLELATLRYLILYNQYWYYTTKVMLRFTNRVYFGSCILEVVEEEQVTDVNLKAWIQCLEEGHQIGIYVSNHTQTQVEGYVVVWYQFDWMNQTGTAETKIKTNIEYKYEFLFSLSKLGYPKLFNFLNKENYQINCKSSGRLKITR